MTRNPTKDPQIGDTFRTDGGLLRTVTSVNPGADTIRLRRGRGGPSGRVCSVLLPLCKFADLAAGWTFVPRDGEV